MKQRRHYFDVSQIDLSDDDAIHTWGESVWAILVAGREECSDGE